MGLFRCNFFTACIMIGRQQRTKRLTLAIVTMLRRREIDLDLDACIHEPPLQH